MSTAGTGTHQGAAKDQDPLGATPTPELLDRPVSTSSQVRGVERMEDMTSFRPESDLQQSTSSITEEHQSEVEQSILAPPLIKEGCHGPTSWLSICTTPAIAWVSARTGVPDFAKSAQGLVLSWTRRFKLGFGASRERALEPDAELAWRFCGAYFEKSYDAIFGIVFRPAFEARLQQHFNGGTPDDPAWYALRNVVYASGCRILLSQDPSSTFANAQKTAWKYFENAIAVHTELLTVSTGVVPIQALALMSYYVEGLGSPALLEYTFCSGAARLAQAQGLHRQLPKFWNISVSEVLHRNWLWWAVYCCEKHIARRSGRPSAIDDDDVNCQIPTQKVAGSTINVEFFDKVIRHWQISSRISRLLCSVKALRTPADRLVEANAYLTKVLHDWYNCLPDSFRIESKAAATNSTSQLRLDHLLYLHNAFHGSVMALHAVFTYPWIIPFLNGKNTLSFKTQEWRSTAAVAEAARAIILATQSIEINANSPHWLPFTYPMFALINLFICVLKNMRSDIVHSDLSLLDMAVGHFARLEIVTSYELSFPFGREVASLARQSVTSINEPPALSDVNLTDPVDHEMSTLDLSLFENVDALDFVDFDVQNRTTLDQLQW